MRLFNRKPKNDPSPTNEFVAQSVNGMKDQQSVNVATWQLNSPESNWDVDLEAGTITFTFTEKVVTADVQIVGTLHNGSFMWGWDHPSVPKPQGRAAELAKKWGGENNIALYTKQTVPADEEKAWEFTAVAARLDNASGTYRANTGDAWIYMAFGPIKMTPRK